MRLPLSVLGILLMLSAHAGAGQLMLARGGQIDFWFNQGLLEAFSIEVDAVDPVGLVPPSEPQGYLVVSLAGTEQLTLELHAPNFALSGFPGGGLSYHGGLRFRRDGQLLKLDGLAMLAVDRPYAAFELVDADGQAWMQLDFVHFELMDEADWLSLRYMDLSALPPMAEALGVPVLAGERIGGAFVSAPIIEQAEGLEPLSSCELEAANWPGTPGFETDIAMINMGAPSFRRCQGCNGSSGGPMVVAPDAVLKNVGSADVPWWEQFTEPQPPYGNDQHPYLVWNLYRLSAAGQLEMIATSALKHAYFTINVGADCPCPGGNILWAGCEDVYGAFSNDLGQYLAGRDEVVPASGLWGRCGSFFDPECDGLQSQSSTNYQHRMQLMESELNSSLHSGARFFIEAWYVVRDDSDIFNAMGWREINPTWNGFNWNFPTVGSMVQGRLADHWAGAGSAAAHRLGGFDSGAGTIRVAARVSDLGNGQWRYDYLVSNVDFVQATVTGQDPDLDVTDVSSIAGFRVPMDPALVLDDIDMARADRMSGQPWGWDRASHHLGWSDPGDTPLNWGRSFRFSFVADSPPGNGPVHVLAAGPEASELMIESLIPAALLFDDRFELGPD
jgi:hypothetical protein